MSSMRWTSFLSILRSFVHEFFFIETINAHPTDSLTLFWKSSTAFWDRKLVKILQDVHFSTLLVPRTTIFSPLIRFCDRCLSQRMSKPALSRLIPLNFYLQLEYWWSETFVSHISRPKKVTRAFLTIKF
jgi:hypothetical protein